MEKNALTNMYDVVIVGGGPAGLTAALYLARACYRVVVVEKEQFGGQITITSEVVNYPGIEKTSGKALTDSMKKQAENFGAEFMLEEVIGFDLSSDIKKVKLKNRELNSFGVLIATGAHPRKIGFAGEEEFQGHGVAYCATCDGEFFTDKEVFVIGGGFAAAEESVFLTKYAKKVNVILRRDDFSCAKQTADLAKANPKIEIIPNTILEEVSGEYALTNVKYSNIKTGQVTERVAEDGDNFGVFSFAGYVPATGLVKGFVDLDDAGYVVTDRNLKTSLEGVYAAGDVCQKSLRQVVTATGDGALAATELERYASQMHDKTGIIPKCHVNEHAHKNADSLYSSSDAVSKSINSSGSSSSGSLSNDSSQLFDSDMLAQLNAVFGRMEKSMLLKVYKDGRAVSEELAHYMTELTKLTDKLSLEIIDGEKLSEEEKISEGLAALPLVRICDEKGIYKGMAFHGVPGGHEFTSFVLGLYNAAGPGQAIDSFVKEKIDRLGKPIDIKIMVSLTCTMCPELVTSAQRIAAENYNVNAEVFDLNHYPEMKDKYHVMSVPCMIINDGKPVFGKKNISQLVDLLQA